MNNLLITNKNLLVEINRINELISPNNNPKKLILLEGLGDIADAMLVKYSNKLNKLFGFTDSKNYETIINSLKKLYSNKRSADFDDVVLNLNPKDSVNELIDIFPKLKQNTKLKFIELIIKYSNENIDTELEQLILGIRNMSSGDLQLLAQSFSEKDFIDRIDPSGGAPEFLNVFLSRYWKKVNNISDILTKDDIATFSFWVSKKGGKTFFSDVRKAWNIEINKIIDNISELNKEFVSKLESGVYGDEQMNEIINAYSLAISRQINMAEMKMKKGAEHVLGRSPDLDSKLKDKILNGKEDIFVLFRKIRGGEGPTGNLIQNQLKDLWDSFSIGLSEKTQKINFRYPQIKVSPELQQYFWSGQWAFLSDFYKIAVKNSSFRSGKGKVAYFLRLGAKSVWGNLLAAGILTFMYTFYTEFKFKEAINKMYEFVGFEVPFKNPEEGRAESESAIIAFFTTWGKSFMEMTSEGRVLIPLFGTIEVSPLGRMVKWGMGKSKFGVQEVKEEIDNDLEKQSEGVPLPGEGELPPLPPEDNNTPIDNNTPNNDGKI